MTRFGIRHRALRATARLGGFLERRLTSAGLTAAGVLVVTAAVGIDTNQTVGFRIFALVAALLAIAATAASRLRGRFEVTRTLPEFATAGRPFRYRLDVRNTSGVALDGLTVFDRPLARWPSAAQLDAELVTMRAAGRAGAMDALWPRRAWTAWAERNRVAETGESTLPRLPAGGSASLTVEIRPVRRGYLRFARPLVSRRDPLGLVRALFPGGAAASLPVLPRRYPVPAPELPGTRAFQPGGISLAASVGDSEEFTSLREYRPGDPLPRIHWKSFARLGEPVVKEYQEEFFERHALVLDTFTGAGEDAVFEEAVSLAASYTAAIDTRDSLLDLLFVGEDAHCLTAGRGQLAAHHLLEALCAAAPRHPAGFERLHQAVAARRASLSGAILVLLALDRPRQALIEALRAGGVPVLAMLVAPPAAALPPQAASLGVRVLRAGEIEAELATP